MEPGLLHGGEPAHYHLMLTVGLHGAAEKVLHFNKAGCGPRGKP